MLGYGLSVSKQSSRAGKPGLIRYWSKGRSTTVVACGREAERQADEVGAGIDVTCLDYLIDCGASSSGTKPPSQVSYLIQATISSSATQYCSLTLFSTLH